MIKKQISCMLIGALPISLINFRGSLIKAMMAEGINIYAVANGNESSGRYHYFITLTFQVKRRGVYLMLTEDLFN